MDIKEQLLHLEAKKADLAKRLARVEVRIVALEAVNVQHEEMIFAQKKIIQDTQASINLYEQDIQQWMLKVELYEKKH